MRGFNRVIIAGNVVRDPDVRATVNKRTFTRFTVGINTMRKNQNGEYQEQTEYVNVVTWGTTAENCGKYLKKGSGVLVEGRLQTSTYEAKDGSGKRYSTDVVADNVQFLSGSSGGNYQRNNNNNNYSRQSAPVQQQNNNRGNNNYNQPPAFEPPTDADFGNPIGPGGFNGNLAPDFLSGDDNSDIPF